MRVRKPGPVHLPNSDSRNKTACGKDRDKVETADSQLQFWVYHHNGTQVCKKCLEISRK